MKRTLDLKVFVDEKAGLSLTVKHTLVEEDGEEKETLSTQLTGHHHGPMSVQDSARDAIEDYLGRIQADLGETPIEAAAKGGSGIDDVLDEVVKRVNAGELDTADTKVTARSRRAEERAR